MRASPNVRQGRGCYEWAGIGLSGACVSFAIHSPAFADNAPMPRECTCEGAERSPPLQWSGAPAGTRSFALILDDPDAPDPRAPQRTWVHWVLFNIPAATQELPEGAAQGRLPAGARQGINDWNRATYGGPCPPVGRHRYVHTLYALDSMLTGLDKPSKHRLLGAMKGHVLGEARLIGTYELRS